jgi:glycosyltransferase involved in cell wall biosynthesis
VASAPFIYVNIGDPRAWLTSRARLARTRVGLRRAAAVAAISPQSAQVLTDWVGVPGRKVRAIPNFRDPGRFRPLAPHEKRQARAQLGLPEGALVVAWIGSLNAEKRPDLAVGVARALPGVTVALAGGGPESDSLRRASEDGTIRLLGPIADPEVLLGAADVLLLTSDTEGVPGVLIEAGLCGIPAACTEVGFVSDVVVDGVTGRLSPAGHAAALAGAVQQCLEHAAAWGAAAHERCRARFTLDTVVPQWEELLAQVADRGRLSASHGGSR